MDSIKNCREIINCKEVGLVEDEQGRYLLSRTGCRTYAIRENSRPWAAIRILDIRNNALDRRYRCANSVITQLESKLQKIYNNRLYKFLHFFGLI